MARGTTRARRTETRPARTSDTAPAQPPAEQTPEQQLVEAYLAGESISEIQKRFGVGPGILYGALRKSGVKPNRPLGRTPGSARSKTSVLPTLEVHGASGDVIGLAGPGGKIVPIDADAAANEALRSVDLTIDQTNNRAPDGAVEVAEPLPLDVPPAPAPGRQPIQWTEPAVNNVAPRPAKQYQVVTERVMRDVLTIDATDFADATRQALRIDGVTEVVSVSRLK
jgi:hypothetical protein